MNYYFCDGCHQYKEPEIDGKHDHVELGYVCNDCEGLTLIEFHKRQTEHLAWLMATEH
jgi:hypothetical protein